jgi:hypothetical protein
MKTPSLTIVRLAFCLFICLLSFPATAQQSWLGQTLGKILGENRPPEKPQYLIYPTLAYAPETSLEFGLKNLLLFHTNQDTTNRLSEVNLFAFLTIRRQFGIWSNHAIYSNRNKWFFLGEDKFQNFPLLYFGIGPETGKEAEATVDTRSLLLRERVLREIIPYIYAGIELEYQQLFDVEFDWEDPANPGTLPTAWEGSRNIGLGLGLIYDNRHNVLNVRNGLFAEAGFLLYNKAWGSEYNFASYFVEGRLFRPVGKTQVLATQLYGLFKTGEIPFNQLALMGGESLMRGYYLGRYRDRNLIAAQVEYRFLPFPFSKRFGGVLFMGAGTVFPEISQALRRPVWAGGAGFRFLLFRQKDIYMRVDLGFTQEGIGPYFFIGEAF